MVQESQRISIMDSDHLQDDEDDIVNQEIIRINTKPGGMMPSDRYTAATAEA